MHKPVAFTRIAASPAAMAVLLASTCLSAAPTLAAEVSATGGATAVGELIVTATKRSENIQKVPMSIQAIDTRRLEQLHVTGFNDYIKFLPAVAVQTFGPDQNTVYIRGVSDGGNANHTGPQPSVGTYLDEQPVTTINGSLDVHIYDIARVEVLEGPQGTLYGASSESGTIRIITNQPSTSGFSSAVNLEGNTVDHGGQGYVFEGFVNVPLSNRAAVRIVAFDEHDAGYIDNVLQTRTYATSGFTFDNAPLVKNDFNSVDTFGGRAALKFDINDNWSITPSIMAQDTRARGFYGFNPLVGDLKADRFQPDTWHDRWYQAALTITGKIGRFDVTYAGAYLNRKTDSQDDYTDYSLAYDAASGYGSYWTDMNGNPLNVPSQFIIGKDRYWKYSNELRIASPSTDRLRFLAGFFQERQEHWIIQDYIIHGFGAADFGNGLVSLAIPGWPQTLWLTDQDRVDRDIAGFGEASFDITPKLTLTGGIRYYHYNNSLFGFFGFSANFAETGFSSTGMGPGSVNCQPGKQWEDAPCVNLDRDVSASGETHKVNLTYHLSSDKMIYFNYATGFRPGGVNRNSANGTPFGPYQADSLSSYEVGWKTSWLDHSLVWNGALYDEDWNDFQFSFLGPNSLTIVENAPSARILGVETNIDWRPTEHLTLTAAANYNDAELTASFCQTEDGFVAPGCPPGSVVKAKKGTRLAFVPKFKIDLGARYTFPIWGWDGHVQANVVYTGARTAAVLGDDIANLGNMPAYATADFSLGAERGKTSIEFYVKNAFDSRGEVDRFTPCTTSVCAVSYPPAFPGAQGVPKAVYVVPTQPMTLGIRVGEKF